MTADPVDVAKLSEKQVRRLLALGNRGPAQGGAVRVESASARPSRVELSDASLRRLSADLRCSVLASGDGPLSFERLMRLEGARKEEFKNKSFLDALLSAHTSRAGLEVLARFGQLLTSDGFPSDAQLVGMVIRSLARFQLFARHGVSPRPGERETTHSLLESLESHCILPQHLREDVFQETMLPSQTKPQFSGDGPP